MLAFLKLLTNSFILYQFFFFPTKIAFKVLSGIVNLFDQMSSLEGKDYLYQIEQYVDFPSLTYYFIIMKIILLSETFALLLR